MKMAAGSISTHSSQLCRFTPSSAAPNKRKQGRTIGRQQGNAGSSQLCRLSLSLTLESRCCRWTGCSDSQQLYQQQKRQLQLRTTRSLVGIAPAPVAIEMNRPCQYDRKMTALTSANLSSGLKGASSSCVPCRGGGLEGKRCISVIC